MSSTPLPEQLATNRRLRKTLGFNVSKPGGILTTEQTALKKEVIAFAVENRAADELCKGQASELP